MRNSDAVDYQLDPEGYFKFETFRIGFNSKYLEPLMLNWRMSQAFFEKRLEEDSDAIVQFDIADEHLKNYSNMVQALAHEWFHLYQTLTLPCICKYSEASRTLNTYKFSVLRTAVGAGLKYRIDEDLLSDRALAHINIDQHLIDDINAEKTSFQNLVDRILTDSQGLNVMDLLEGSAFAFQLLMGKDPENKAIPGLSESKKYNRAFTVFCELVDFNDNVYGQKTVALGVFCLISYISMACYDDEIGNIVPVFRHLCGNTEKYMTQTISQLGSNFQKFGDHKPNYKHSELVQGDPDLHKGMNEGELNDFVVLADLLDEILDDVECFNEIYTQKADPTDDKLRSIRAHFLASNPHFSSIYFLPYLLAKPSDLQHVIEALNSIGTLTHHDIYYGDRMMSVDEDSSISEMLEQFESILDPDTKVKCCNLHGDVGTVSELLKCSEADSLNTVFYQGTGAYLSQFIEVI